MSHGGLLSFIRIGSPMSVVGPEEFFPDPDLLADFWLHSFIRYGSVFIIMKCFRIDESVGTVPKNNKLCLYRIGRKMED